MSYACVGIRIESAIYAAPNGAWDRFVFISTNISLLWSGICACQKKAFA
jgi:hypothetical protein